MNEDAVSRATSIEVNRTVQLFCTFSTKSKKTCTIRSLTLWDSEVYPSPWIFLTYFSFKNIFLCSTLSERSVLLPAPPPFWGRGSSFRLVCEVYRGAQKTQGPPGLIYRLRERLRVCSGKVFRNGMASDVTCTNQNTNS